MKPANLKISWWSMVNVSVWSRPLPKEGRGCPRRSLCVPLMVAIDKFEVTRSNRVNTKVGQVVREDVRAVSRGCHRPCRKPLDSSATQRSIDSSLCVQCHLVKALGSCKFLTTLLVLQHKQRSNLV